MRFGIPLEAYKIKLGEISNLDEAIISFEKHMEEVLKERIGNSVKVKAYVLEEGQNIVLLPILVAGATE